MTKSEKNLIDRLYKKNRRVIAQYLALYTECIGMKKIMITFTPNDKTMNTLIKMRKIFFTKLNRYKRNKNGDLTIKYFSNIEFTSSGVPHIHIQLFYLVSKTPIEKAYKYLVNSKVKNTNKNSISYAKDDTQDFDYVIKDYKNFNYNLELKKRTYKDIKFITSSQKTISNKVIRFLLNKLTFKTKNKYKEILELIQNGLLSIFKDTKNKKKDKNIINTHLKKYKFNKKVTVLFNNTIGIYKIYLFSKRSKHRALKNKKYIKRRRTIKNKTKLNIQPRNFTLVWVKNFYDYFDF